MDSAISLSAIHLSTVDFVMLRFLTGGHSKLLDAERFLWSDMLKLSGVRPLSRALHMSAVVCLNPSGVSRCTCCNVYRVLCRAMYAFTEAHASSMGLSSQWATGRRSTVCPCSCAALSVRQIGVGLCCLTFSSNVFLMSVSL